MKLLDFYKSHKILTAIIGLLLIFAFWFYFTIVPKLINIEKYRVLIIKETDKSLKLPMEIGKSYVTMTWNLGVRIHADSVTVKHLNNTPYIATGPIDVEISIPYILKHQIRVRKINLHNAYIDLKRLPSGKFDIEELISPKTKKAVKYKTIFHNTKINIDNYNMVFTDLYVSPSPQYFVSGSKLKIYDFDPQKLIKVDAQGRIYSKNRHDTKFNINYSAALPLDVKNIFKNQLSIQGHVENLYPDMYSRYLQDFTKEYSYMSGVGDGNISINLSRKESDIDEIYFKGTVRDFSLYKREGKNPPAFPGRTDVSVLLQQKNKNIIIKDLSFNNKDINAKIKGHINIFGLKEPEFDLNLITDNSKIEPMAAFLPQTNKNYNDILKRLKKYTIKGVISTDLNIKGTPKTPKLLGELELKNFSLSKGVEIIPKTNIKVDFNDNTYNIISNVFLNENGFVGIYGLISTKDNKINLDVISNTIKWEYVQRLIIEIGNITNIKPDFIKKARISGKGNVNLNIQGNIQNPDIKGHIKFLDTNISSSYMPVNVTNLKGQIKLNDKNIIVDNLRAHLGRGSVNINGELDKKNQKIEAINLDIKGKINSKDIEKYIKPHTNAKGLFPFTISIKGPVSDWKLSGRVDFNKEGHISLKQDIGLPLDRAQVLNVKVSGNRKKIKLENIELLAASTASASDYTELSPLLTARGIVYEIPSNKFLFDNFALDVNPLSTQISDKTIAAQPQKPLCDGKDFSPQIETAGAAGAAAPVITAPVASAESIVIKNITLPSKKLTVNFAVFDLTADKIILTDSDIDIADSKLKINAEAPKELTSPLTINKINITSPDLNFDNIAAALNQKSTDKEISLPVIIESGNIQAQKFSVDKLKGTDLASAFNLNSYGVFELQNLAFNAKGGAASGNIKYNIKTTDLEGTFITESMEANELATTFMNLPDEIYGELDSNSEFKTKGKELKDMIAHADGKIEFKIKDGHLVRLGSLEYLLLTANTLLAGVGNLDLNKIFNLIAPEKTGYFKTLEGTITIKDGVLNTDNTRSRGKNLSLRLNGSLRMSDDYADMTILGRLRNRTAGKLGPLGRVSINSIISNIPIAGYTPGLRGNVGAIDFIPLLDKIPVLGVGGKFARQRYRFFVVKITGNLYDPDSVKSFTWITKKDIKKYRPKKSRRRARAES